MNKLSNNEIIGRLTHLIQMGQVLLNETFKGDSFGTLYCKDISGCHSWRVQCLSFLYAIIGKESIHHKYFEGMRTTNKATTVEAGIGVLRATIEDVKGGYLTKYESLGTADIFADFLEMAGHLLDKDYKDPAAVLIGGILEERLRKLCLANEIEITDSKGKPVEAGKMNEELAKKGVYSKLQHQSVISWQTLRNHAAHGEYDKYDAKEVKLMLDGVRDFVGKFTV